MVKIFLPSNINFLYLNNLYIYIYNFNFFLMIRVNSHRIFFNKSLYIINLQKKVPNNNKIVNKRIINLFLFTWNNFFFSKIYFLGKGFKLKKFKNNIVFNFNYSHINSLIIKNIILKKIQKNKLIIFCKNNIKLTQIKKLIINLKNLNPYTKRGLRINKQIVYKKKNKSNI